PISPYDHGGAPPLRGAPLFFFLRFGAPPRPGGPSRCFLGGGERPPATPTPSPSWGARHPPPRAGGGCLVEPRAAPHTPRPSLAPRSSSRARTRRRRSRLSRMPPSCRAPIRPFIA